MKSTAIRQAHPEIPEEPPSIGVVRRAGAYAGLVRSTPDGPRWTGEVRFIEEALPLPLRWRAPRRVFVNSMSDLFHEKVADVWIDQIFAVMALGGSHRRYFGVSGHTFQVLTKRPEQLRMYMDDPDTPKRIAWKIEEIAADDRSMRSTRGRWPDEVANAVRRRDVWPLECVWLGVSVEDPPTAKERWSYLRDTPAAVRWISYEPGLAGVDFIEAEILPRRRYAPAIEKANGVYADWIVCGGESGPGARPFDLAWARATIAQGRAAGVPVFVKQLGSVPIGTALYQGESWPAHVRVEPHDGDGCPALVRLRLRDRKGGDPSEWPEDIRVRELP